MCVNTKNSRKDPSCNFLYNIVHAADISKQSNASFSRLGYKKGKHSENKNEINKNSQLKTFFKHSTPKMYMNRYMQNCILSMQKMKIAYNN